MFRTICILVISFTLRVFSQTDYSTSIHSLFIQPFKNLPDDLEAGFVTHEKKPQYLSLSVLTGTSVLTSLAYRFDSNDETGKLSQMVLGSKAGIISNLGLGLSLAAPFAIYTTAMIQKRTGKNDRYYVDLGQQMFESLFLSSVTALTVKYLSGRTRPDGSDRQSFPSFHSSVAFSVGTTLAVNASPYIGIPALVGATLVGLSRIGLQKHYGSDVLLGAGIGAFYSTSVWLNHNASIKKLGFSPWIGPSSLGVTWTGH